MLYLVINTLTTISLLYVLRIPSQPRPKLTATLFPSTTLSCSPGVHARSVRGFRLGRGMAGERRRGQFRRLPALPAARRRPARLAARRDGRLRGADRRARLRSRPEGDGQSAPLYGRGPIGRAHV